MAEWIPRCKGLNRKPEVLAIALATGRTRHDVADLLCEFWEWADSETEDGRLPGLTIETLSIVVPDTDDQFWTAVVQVGWLQVEAPTLIIPNFERWLGRCAKKRLKDVLRQQTHRARKPTPDLSRNERDKSVTTVQDITEQEKEACASFSPAEPGEVPPAVRVRRLLKFALRGCGLRLVRMEGEIEGGNPRAAGDN